MIALTVYNNVPIQENHYIDNIEAFLTQYIANILSFKFYNNKEFLDDPSTLTLKVELQNGLEDFDYVNTNYARIEDNGMIRYYFVTSIEMVSEFVVKLVLSLDVVNSYQSYVKNTSNFKQVSIKRRHKNRWKLNNVTKNYERQFDKVDEGFGDLPTQVDVTREVNDEDFYLLTKEVPSVESADFWNFSGKLFSNIYCNESNQEKYSIKNYYISETNSSFCKTSTGSTEKMTTVITCDKPILCTTIGTINHIADLFILVTYNAVIYSVQRCDAYLYSYKRTANGKYTCVDVRSDIITGRLVTEKSFHFEGLSSNLTWYYNCQAVPNIDGKEWSLDDLIGSSATKHSCSTYDVSTTLAPITSIDTTDSSIKTIINVPIDVQSSNLIWFNNSACCVFNDLITCTKNFDISSDNILSKINKTVRTRDINYESKLYGSYVRNYYIAYDTFKLPVQPEYLNSLSNLQVTTYVPNDMTTNIMIVGDGIIETGYHSNVLMCSRNNNLSVFSNEYLEYIRNGYNYDQKNQTMSNISNWINAGVSIFGTGVGAASAYGKNKGTAGLGGIMALNVAQMGVSAATALGSAIMSTVQNEAALQNKRNNLLNSSVNMSGSDDVLLFKQINYGYNLIQYVIEAPRTELLNSIWNLFYFTGYADNLYYDEMPTIKTREYFNYVQADINNCVITNNKIRNRVVAAYASGITFEWLYNNTWLNSGVLYENWETSF